MSDDHAGMLWFGLALAAGLAAAPGLLAGGFPLIPIFLAVVGLACAAHRPSRLFVTAKMGQAFSGSRVRSLIIVFGAILMIQILPIELALLMAGDVLAYVELVAAVSLISGRARWPLLKARLEQAGRRVAAVIRRQPVARTAGPTRRWRSTRPASGDDDSEGALAWAFA